MLGNAAITIISSVLLWESRHDAVNFIRSLLTRYDWKNTHIYKSGTPVF